MTFSAKEAKAHNQHYDHACKLIKGELYLDGLTLPRLGFIARFKLKKAKKHFKAAIAINPSGWQSIFFIGKIEQRLGNQKEALDWMLKAHEFVPDNTSIAKEASLTASNLGMYQMAAQLADNAIQSNPNDAALMVNSGLAHICNGDAEMALSRFKCAAELEPEQKFNQRLVSYAGKVLTGIFPVPKSEADIIRATNKTRTGFISS